MESQKDLHGITLDDDGNRRCVNGWRLESLRSVLDKERLETTDINKGIIITFYYCLLQFTTCLLQFTTDLLHFTNS